MSKRNKRKNKKNNQHQNGQTQKIEIIEPVIPIEMAFSNIKEKNKISKIINKLAQSEHGKKVLNKAVENKTRIVVVKEKGLSGSYDPNKNIVTFSPYLDENSAICTLAHELRHAEKGNIENPVLVDHALNIKSLTMSMRAMEADAYSYEAICALELKEKNIQGPEKEACPPFVEAVKKSIAKEGKLIPEKAMLEGFQAFFNDDYLKSAYENIATGYMHNFVKLNEREFNCSSYYEKERNSKSILQNLTSIDDKPYISSDSKILEQDKNLEVREYFYDVFNDFFKLREKKTGIKADQSLQQMPVKNRTKPNQLTKAIMNNQGR